MGTQKLDLGWMRIFVESARRGSFSAAAAALGLTQPAISYQIRRLEEQLGFAVLRRRHQGVELTAQGRQLFDIVDRSVVEIDVFLREQARTARRAAVRLHTDYAFASFWLIPRMHRFRQYHHEIDIQIVATQRFQPDEAELGDIAVIFSDQSDDATMLLAEEVVPVCTPALLAQLNGDAGGVAHLNAARLINLDAAAPSPWLDWPRYFAAQHLSRNLSQQGDLSFNTYSLVVQAALESQGVALGWKGLVDSYLRSGVLVAAGPAVRSPQRGYVLVPPATATEHGRHFMTWLVSEVAREP